MLLLTTMNILNNGGINSLIEHNKTCEMVKKSCWSEYLLTFNNKTSTNCFEKKACFDLSYNQPTIVQITFFVVDFLEYCTCTNKISCYSASL